MEIKSKEISLVDINLLKENPENTNKHPDEQIERLAKIIKESGFRTPLTVSNRSGYVLCGHGRIDAARKLGMTQLPVIYQDFKDEIEEYAHLNADNEIARWATTDLSMVNQKILDLGPFDIDLLGIKDFVVEPMDMDFPDLGDGSDPDIQQVTFTLSNEQKDIIDQAMDKAKKELDCTDEINENKNGNTLAAICRAFNYVS